MYDYYLHLSLCEVMEILNLRWCWEYRLIHGTEE